MIRVILIACFLLFGISSLAEGQSRDAYTINEIPVDEQAETVGEAQLQAFAAARLAGAVRLIERLTLPEDRLAATDLIIDQVFADRIAAAVDVEEEVAGAGRYRGSLAVVYNPVEVRAALNEVGLPFTDSLAPQAVLFTTTSNGMDLAWNMAWEESPKGSLVPLLISRSAGYAPDTPWDVLQQEISLYGAQRAIFADLRGSNGGYVIELISVTASGPRRIGVTRRAPTVEEAIQAVALRLNDDWKQTSIIRDTSRTLIEATVSYTSLAEWITLRRALVQSPLVSNVQTRAISTDGAFVAFAFAGDGQRLISDLRDRGVVITAETIGWVMSSAVSAPPQLEDN
ncbi:MAG: hypothetical protein HRT81_06500 [Henriciella sp.]|nr:hypothetical protein [Henriciella sp.]